MNDLQARAEAVKLGRLLDCDEQSLAFLQALPVQDTRAFRQSVCDALFDAHRNGFVRLAKLSSMLPTGLSAKLSQKALGAMLSARVASELKPERAVALAKKLPADFMARLSLDLDPRRAAAVVAAMPVAIVVPVALELLAAREYITMARFVDALSDDTLKAVVDAIDDDEGLLRIGFFVENDGRLDQLVNLLPPQRLAGTMAAAVQVQLWPEVLALAQRVGGETRRRLALLFLEHGEQALGQLLDAAEQGDLWPQVIALFVCLPESGQTRLARLLKPRPQEYEHIMAAAGQLGQAQELAAVRVAFEADSGR